MTPIELQRKWNLSNTQLAIALGKTEGTILKYKVRPSSKSYRNPPETVVRLCIQLDKDWSQQRKADIQFVAV